MKRPPYTFVFFLALALASTALAEEVARLQPSGPNKTVALVTPQSVGGVRGLFSRIHETP